MIIVPIKEGENIERALKKFKRKFEKTGAIRELRARKNFEKSTYQDCTEPIIPREETDKVSLVFRKFTDLCSAAGTGVWVWKKAGCWRI